MRSFTKRILCLVGALALGCQEGSGPTEVITGITIDPVGPLTSIGQSVDLVVRAYDGQGSAFMVIEDPRLSSSDPSVISIAGHTARAQGYGTAIITAEFQGFEGTAFLEVLHLPATLVKLAGDGQVLPIGSFVSTLPTVQVLDAQGAPMAGIQVAFSVPNSDQSGQAGSVIGGPVTTNALGKATVGGWWLGTAAGPKSLVATAGPVSTTFTAVATPASPTHVEFAFPWNMTTGFYAEGAPLTPPVEVQIKDAAGNLVTGSAAQVIINLGANPGGGTLGGTTSVQAVGGLATFSDLSISVPGRDYTLVASAPGLKPDTTRGFNIYGQAIQLEVEGPGTVAAGNALNSPLRVFALDASGSPDLDFTGTVTLSMQTNPVGGTLRGNLQVAGSNGSARFSNVSIDKAGAGYSLLATSPGLAPDTSAAFTIIPSSPFKLAMAVEPITSQVNVPIAPEPQVAVQDSLGNLVSTANHFVSAALGVNPAGATLLGTVGTNASNGLVSFDLRLNASGTGYTLVFSSPGLISVSSTPFDVTP